MFSQISRHLLFKGACASHRQIKRMQSSTHKTIFALSSGHGKCGVAVFRITGERSSAAITSMTKLCRLPPSRHARVVKFHHPQTKEHLDTGILIWFPGPQSVTGEDCVEFHVHGGTAVVTAISSALSLLHNFRHAEPGEFTKRAFVNGKLNLSEVEGLADLIDAETDAQRRLSLRQLDGELSLLYSRWRCSLIKCLANVEAYIDFSEEEQIEDGILQSCDAAVGEMVEEMKVCVSDSRRGERLKHGVNVAIVGQPNVGKSTLLNMMRSVVTARRPTAIVSSIAGTTRDVIESVVDIGGYPVLFSDTAGLRHTSDIVEYEGVSRALNTYNNADIRIVVIDTATVVPDVDNVHEFVDKHLSEIDIVASSRGQAVGSHCPPISEQDSGVMGPHVGMQHVVSDVQSNHIRNNNSNHDTSVSATLSSDRETSQSFIHDRINYRDNATDGGSNHGDYLQQTSSVDDERITLVVLNKSDLLNEHELGTLGRICTTEPRVFLMSCVTNDGFHHFLQALQSAVAKLCTNAGGHAPAISRTRHKHHLTDAILHLEQYQTLQYTDVVVAAESLRLAIRDIGRITGEIRTSDVLDVLFSDFCIGK